MESREGCYYAPSAGRSLTTVIDTAGSVETHCGGSERALSVRRSATPATSFADPAAVDFRWTRIASNRIDRSVGCHAAHNHLDPGVQFIQIEWLADIVIGAELHPFDLLRCGIKSGDHDDRYT